MIEKINLKRNRDSIRFWIIIFFFVGGYTFFFTSQIWMPATADASYLTKTGVENNWDNRTVTINRWEYSKTQNMMEVELSINNKTYDGNNDYTFSAVDLRGRKIKTKTVISDEDWIILQLRDVPERWSDISLRMDLEKSDSGVLKLYTNINAVTKVSKINTLDYKGYKIKRFNIEIDQMEKQVTDRQKQQEDLKRENKEIEKEITRLNESKTYKTDEEREKVDEKIKSANTTMTTNEQTINELDGEIAEYNNRIELKKKQIDDLNAGE